MNNNTIDKVGEILEECVEKTLGRVKKNLTHRPFHDALLTRELVKASAFERSFSTSLGQGPIERISKIIAEGNGFHCFKQHETQVNLYKGALDEIELIISNLRGGISKPNWEKELIRINSHRKGDTVVRRVISDIHLIKGEKKIFISLKTVKPNLDQTSIAKTDMLLLKADEPSSDAYLALYYNPGGDLRTDYNWTVPSKIFNMYKDPCILIGKDYWDFIGGEGTYNDLLNIFTVIGEKTKALLQK